MAYILNDGQTHEDRYGNVYTSVYAAIDTVINCKRKKNANVILNYYISKEAADSGKEPIGQDSLIVENKIELINDQEVVSNDYDNYMSHEVVAANGSEFTKAYAIYTEKKLDKQKYKSDE